MDCFSSIFKKMIIKKYQYENQVIIMSNKQNINMIMNIEYVLKFKQFVDICFEKGKSVQVAVRFHCGSQHSTYCEPIDEKIMNEISQEFLFMVRENMIQLTDEKVRFNKWEFGNLGSIWTDIEPTKYGVDFIRCSVQSKRISKDWSYGKFPYCIIIIADKIKTCYGDFVLTPELENELPPLEEFTDDEN